MIHHPARHQRHQRLQIVARAAAFALGLAACAAPVGPAHVTAAPVSEPAPEPVASSEVAPGAAQSTFWRDGTFIRGRTVDATGQPARARVAAVTGCGSFSTAGPGDFELPQSSDEPMTLTATTPDGRFAWRALGEDGLTEDGPVTLNATAMGAWLDLELDRADDTRVEVFQDGVRIHDLTLRAGKRRSLVVPAGVVAFRLKRAGVATHAVSLDAGERHFARLH